jgi:hypothetical protein
MTADEADALAANLKRAGVYVHAVEPRISRGYYDGTDDWQLYCWCDDPPHFYVRNRLINPHSAAISIGFVEFFIRRQTDLLAHSSHNPQMVQPLDSQSPHEALLLSSGLHPDRNAKTAHILLRNLG